MRIDDTTEVWWVINPMAESVLDDICIRASIRSIQHQLARATLSAGSNQLVGLTLYTEREEAERAAKLRLEARDIYKKALAETRQ